MNFHELLQVASAQQNDIELQKNTKRETKPAAPKKISNDRKKGVISANVRAFLERKEKEEKRKDDEERRKKEELLKKRDEVKHGKKAKAMASRTKDNLQYYTKEKLDRFIAEEKEREQRQKEKEERKQQKQLGIERRKEDGITRKRRTKFEIAKDKGLSTDMPKADVGVKVEKKKKITKQAPPSMDFNAILKLAQEKQKGPGKASANKVKTERPMTQEEKERWLRVRSKEYQHFLKNGGKRPDFPGKKSDVKEESSDQPKKTSSELESNAKSSMKRNDIKRMDENYKKKGDMVPNKGISSNSVPKKYSTSKENTSMMTQKSVPKTSSKSASKPTDKSKHKKESLPKTEAFDTAEVNETVIQCGPSKPKPDLKRRFEEPRMNPFDRIINRFSMNKPPEEKKRRAMIESDSEEEYDSEMDDFIDDDDEGEDYSSAIRDIFGYDKKKYRYEDDDLSDMEATFSSIMKEEARSAKIGMMEDLEDMRREEEELRMKAQRKKLMKQKMKRR